MYSANNAPAHEKRISLLNAQPAQRGYYVLYWMQASQRAKDNAALEYAVSRANALNKPVVVCFGLYAGYPEANQRHFAFVLQGLKECEQQLADRDIPMRVSLGRPDVVALAYAKAACLVVADKGYLRHQRLWRQAVAEQAACPVLEIEADAVVPVAHAYPKQAYNAAVLRRRIMPLIADFLTPLPSRELTHADRDIPPSLPVKELTKPDSAPASLELAPLSPCRRFHGGYGQARQRLDDFIANKLPDYHLLARDPATDCRSGLSPYLHFGHISPCEIARDILAADAPQVARTAFIEELVVRRELALNFVWYNTGYDRYDGAVPDWASRTLADHEKDTRPYAYGYEDLATGKTHDPYWNAAQRELSETGHMHGYLRMYWGKKILEWTENPKQAYTRMVSLNNTYQLDGRDPNSYAGIAWCLGLHDRPWRERTVFGKVRYMNARGLERKFAMKRYIERVAQMASREKASNRA